MSVKSMHERNEGRDEGKTISWGSNNVHFLDVDGDDVSVMMTDSYTGEDELMKGVDNDNDSVKDVTPEEETDKSNIAEAGDAFKEDGGSVEGASDGEVEGLAVI